MKIHLNSESRRKEAYDALAQLEVNGAYEVTLKKLPKTRTSLQNRALHKYCSLLAEKLNEAGLSFYTVLLRNTNKFISLNSTRFESPKNDYERGFIDALEAVGATLPKLQTSWNKELVKEIFWVPVQKKAVGKTKTSECETKDYGIVYEDLNLALGEQLGVHVPWPQDENKTR